jgi:hypothetical protein
MNRSKTSLVDLFARILVILGFLTTVIAFITELAKITTDAQKLRIASIAGFVTYFASTLWLAFKATNVKTFWRWVSLVLLYVITVPYFIWMGTWIREGELLVAGKQTAVTELQPTIDALSNTIPIATNPPSTPFTQLITVTQIVQVTPTPDMNVLLIDDIPSEVFPFSDGVGPQTSMSATYDESGTINYKLDYSLPVQGDTFAGIAMRFPPMNIATYEYIEVAVVFSNTACCYLKLADQTGKQAEFLLEGSPPPNTRVTIVIDGDRRIIRIPLREHFGGVNLGQIREISFISYSTLATGGHSFTVSRMKLLKQ